MKKIARSLMIASLMAMVALPAMAQTDGEQTTDKPRVARRMPTDRPIRHGSSPEQTERMIERRCSQLIEEMQLDEATSVKFKEVYTAFQTEQNALREKYRQPRDTAAADKPHEFTEQEMDQLFKQKRTEQREKLDLELRYYDQFRTFLTAQQAERALSNRPVRHARSEGDKKADKKVDKKNDRKADKKREKQDDK